MSNDEQFVKIDYLTLEVGDPVYWLYEATYEPLGEVSEFTSTHVYVGHAAYSPKDIEECYTLNKNFYNPRKPKDFTKKMEFPKKVLTNEEIYEMLLSDPSLHHVSLKAVRKIENTIIRKLRKQQR